VAWQGSGLALLREPRGWAREAGRLRRAGVSSFGISGTNAHVVLEEPPVPREVAVAAAEAPLVPGEAAGEAAGTKAQLRSLPLLVSGRDEAALRSQAGRWADWLRSHPETDLAAVVRTAAVNRTHFDARAAIQADDVGQAQDALDALAQGRAHPAVSAGRCGRSAAGVRVPGPRCQWPDGPRCSPESAVFAAIDARRHAVAAYEAVGAPCWGGRRRRGAPLERVDVVQRCCLRWRSGLRRCAVSGCGRKRDRHSVGDRGGCGVRGAEPRVVRAWWRCVASSLRRLRNVAACSRLRWPGRRCGCGWRRGRIG
jgi:hypothetical protein